MTDLQISIFKSLFSWKRRVIRTDFILCFRFTFSPRIIPTCRLYHDYWDTLYINDKSRVRFLVSLLYHFNIAAFFFPISNWHHHICYSPFHLRSQWFHLLKSPNISHLLTMVIAFLTALWPEPNRWVRRKSYHVLSVTYPCKTSVLWPAESTKKLAANLKE